MIRQYEVAYEHEWFHGLINTFVITTEIGLDTRIAFKEVYLEGKFSRVTIKSKYPIILIRYRYGAHWAGRGSVLLPGKYGELFPIRYLKSMMEMNHGFMMIIRLT